MNSQFTKPAWLSRINILFAITLLIAISQLPEVRETIPPSWQPYILSLVAVLGLIERTLGKDHKNLTL